MLRYVYLTCSARPLCAAERCAEGVARGLPGRLQEASTALCQEEPGGLGTWATAAAAVVLGGRVLGPCYTGKLIIIISHVENAACKC